MTSGIEALAELTSNTQWLGSAQTDRNAEPRGNLYNVMLALRQDRRIAELFAYDEMLRAPILLAPVPNRTVEGDNTAFSPGPVRDADVSALQELLQHAGLEKIGKDVVHQGVDLVAHERCFHPVRDYLNGAAWDGNSRLATWLTVYLALRTTNITAPSGRCFSS